MDGMVPVSLFENSSKFLRDDRHPIVDGILPMRLLLCKDKVFSVVMPPILVGMKPVILFEYNCIV